MREAGYGKEDYEKEGRREGTKMREGRVWATRLDYAG